LQYERNGALRYHTAFSRDGHHGLKRVYVQDVMKDNLSYIGSLLVSHGAYVYISGYECLLRLYICLNFSQRLKSNAASRQVLFVGSREAGQWLQHLRKRGIFERYGVCRSVI
jgi:hypothetical protein